MHNIKSIINNAPTVEAIPKADYEARLKANTERILEEVVADCEKLSFDFEMFNRPMKALLLDAVKNSVKDKIRGLEDGNDDT